MINSSLYINKNKTKIYIALSKQYILDYLQNFTFKTLKRRQSLHNLNLIQSEEKKKSIYREIFVKINEAFLNKFNTQKIRLSCKNCDIYSQNCTHYPINPTQKLPTECIFRFWQEKCLNELENEIAKSICEKIIEINKLRDKYQCNRCAACCKLASSEFSFEELKERAKNGDIFAKDFISIFVPYENIDEARAQYPEFFDLLKKKYNSDNGIYFYHCPKIGKDNLCSDYENRPNICRDFPNNPLVIFPKDCGYRKWQDEVDILALTLHAMVEITDFYKNKISQALQKD